MYNQTVETFQFGVLNPQKYSLRHKHSHKITNDHPLAKGLPAQDSHWNKKTQTFLHPSEMISQRSRIICKDEAQSLQFNCFDGARNAWQFNQNTQISYQSNYRTPSTTNSVHNHVIQPLKFEKDFLRTEGEPKYSLKNTKKQYNSKVNSRFTYNGVRQMSDQRHAGENISQQVSTDGRPTDEINSETGHFTKFSLRSGIKKHSKPEVLLSLKFEDLIGLARIKSNTNLYLYPQPTSTSQGGNFCNISKGDERGCRCEPKCLWMNRWQSIIGQVSWNEGCRKRSESQWKESLKQIERDLPRTQPDHPAFQTPKLKDMMKEVLVAYAQLDSEVGYVQGMNFVAAVLVYHSRTSYEALNVFTYIMKVCGFRKLFLGDLSYSRKLAGRLTQDLRRLVYDLYVHLTEEGVDLELFASSWYFSLCGSFVPLNSMHIFIDKFMKKGFTGVNELLLTLLLYNKDKLMQLEDSHLMLEFSNQKLYESGEQIDWADIKDRSDRILLSPLEN